MGTKHLAEGTCTTNGLYHGFAVFLLMSTQEKEFPRCLSGKGSACDAGDTEMWVLSLGWEDPLEKEMATHSSILAWEIPWTQEPGGL